MWCYLLNDFLSFKVSLGIQSLQSHDTKHEHSLQVSNKVKQQKSEIASVKKGEKRDP